MPRTLYDRVPVRDGLAGERTVLSAERTFLAYVRTSFAMFIAGLTGAHLLQSTLIRVSAYAITVMSVVVFAVGIWRFKKSREETLCLLSRLDNSAPDNSAPDNSTKPDSELVARREFVRRGRRHVGASER